MEKIFNAFFSFIRSLCKIMIFVQVVCVTIVVVGRYVFNTTPPWGEELTLFCLVWLSLLGASLPLRNGTHLRITMLDHILPKKVLFALNVLCDVVVTSFSVAIIISGVSMTIQVSGSILYGMHISKGFLYAAVPTAGFAYLIAEIERILRWVKTKGSETV